ncbi:hypothetical protein B0H14DRAFT_3567207 [Mycena olivaceomarginata]|nr:hypothetical protein B0H14DRAFT_3567207 [Mycena olivaceomarginata]
MDGPWELSPPRRAIEAHTGPLTGLTPGISSTVSTRRDAHWASNGRGTGQAVVMSIRRGAHWASNRSDAGNLPAMLNHLTGWTRRCIPGTENQCHGFIVDTGDQTHCQEFRGFLHPGFGSVELEVVAVSPLAEDDWIRGTDRERECWAQAESFIAARRAVKDLNLGGKPTLPQIPVTPPQASGRMDGWVDGVLLYCARPGSSLSITIADHSIRQGSDMEDVTTPPEFYPSESRASSALQL